jgi:hypothetical protein
MEHKSICREQNPEPFLPKPGLKFAFIVQDEIPGIEIQFKRDLLKQVTAEGRRPASEKEPVQFIANQGMFAGDGFRGALNAFRMVAFHVPRQEIPDVLALVNTGPVCQWTDEMCITAPVQAFNEAIEAAFCEDHIIVNQEHVLGPQHVQGIPQAIIPGLSDSPVLLVTEIANISQLAF